MGEWGAPPDNRATQIEVQRREAEALEMLLDGHSRTAVIAHLAEAHSITERTAGGYYSRAKARGREELGATLKEIALRSARRRDRIYQRAMLKDDLATALRAEESLFKLLGVDRLPLPVSEAEEGHQGRDIAEDALSQIDVRMLAPATLLKLLTALEGATPVLAKLRHYSREEMDLIKAHATHEEIQEMREGKAEIAVKILKRVRKT